MLQILIHKVGHGQAIHAFTPNGQTIVIDLGRSADFSPLEWLGVSTKTIDSLIITHPHGDHIDEIALLNELGISVRQMWCPRWLPREEVYKQNQSSYTKNIDTYFELLDLCSENIRAEELVGNFSVSGGVSINKFVSGNCGVSNINNHSGVVVFEYQGIIVVIPGDNEPASWHALMEQPEFVNTMKSTNVFMASHHGRESGYCSDIFVSKPNLCIVSDGRPQKTDARDKYTYHATCWNVNRRSNNMIEKRSCLTTRSDGFIDIRIGQNQSGSRYLSIDID